MDQKIKYLLLSVLSCVSLFTVPGSRASAENLKSQGATGIHVMPMNPEIPVETLKKDGYQVHPYERKIEGNTARELPDPVKRDQVLIQAGLEKTIFKWDQLERDMLYMRARTMSIKDLQSKYPKLPKRSLEKLKELIRQAEAT